MKFYTKLIFTFFISINFLFVKADEGMWLPIFAELKQEEQDFILEQLKEVLDELR